MPVFKKIYTSILAIVLLASTGCSSEVGKVNVISGPGKANLTMLISFNELCSGSVEGFLGKNGKLLTSLKVNTDLLFSEIDSDNGTKRELFSTTLKEAASVEIAPNGSRFIYNNYLINASTGLAKQLPLIFMETSNSKVDTTTLLSYSFTDSSEILFTNPIYYIKKYISPGNNIKTSITKNKNISISYKHYMPLGDRRPTPGTSNSESMTGFKDMIIPDITSIKTTHLIPESLKFIFTAGTHENRTQLYTLDLYEKKFTLIANSIKDYSLSPGRSIVAFIEGGQNGSDDTLMTINLETGFRKELLSLPQIDAVAWSLNSSWIAYSGGSTKIDVGIIKADGNSNEQLTNGMHPSGKPAWSFDGKKLAFTSQDMEKGSLPKVYIIALNNQEDAWFEASSTDSARTAAASKLIEYLKYETRLFLNDMEGK